MAFSRNSINAIWKREGETKAKCNSCNRRCADGWSLDCSHVDHTRDATYDDPSRGVLECLWCHLKRHITLFYKLLISPNLNKRVIRENRYFCQALWNRILAGEDRYDRGPNPRSGSEIKAVRKEINSLILQVLKFENLKAKLRGVSKETRKEAEKRILELSYMIR